MDMKRLRKLIRENIKKALSESMDMGIQDFKYESDLDNILDICHYIVKKVAYDLYPKLGLSDQEKEEIGGIGDDFTPDGSDAFEPVGTVNFYVNGWPVKHLEKVVGYVKYILNEKDIKVGEVRYEKVKDKINPADFAEWGITDGGESLRVIRIPILENNSGDSGNPPVLNLSNANAHKLFGEILGFENGGSSYHMDATDLLMKINSVKKGLAARTDIPDNDEHSQSGIMYSTVNGKGYYYDMLDKVAEFASWAIARGYRSLYVA